MNGEIERLILNLTCKPNNSSLCSLSNRKDIIDKAPLLGPKLYENFDMSPLSLNNFNIQMSNENNDINQIKNINIDNISYNQTPFSCPVYPNKLLINSINTIDIGETTTKCSSTINESDNYKTQSKYDKSNKAYELEDIFPRYSLKENNIMFNLNIRHEYKHKKISTKTIIDYSQQSRSILQLLRERSSI